MLPYFSARNPWEVAFLALNHTAVVGMHVLPYVSVSSFFAPMSLGGTNRGVDEQRTSHPAVGKSWDPMGSL